jgi:hypothetical protein
MSTKELPTCSPVEWDSQESEAESLPLSYASS